MKKLFIAMMVCLLAASTSYAFESTITGAYNVRGQFLSFDEDDTKDQAFYDQDLDIYVQINTDENTYLNFALEARDADYMDNIDVDKDHTINSAEITVMSVWLTHKFGTGTTLEVGDMAEPLFFGSGMTTYAFEDGIEGLSIKVTQDIGIGSVYAITEKLDEVNAKLDEPFEGDIDAYAIGAVLNFDNIVVQPRIAYIADDSAADNNMLIVNLYGTGTFGKLSVMADFAYISAENGADEFDLFGALVDVNYDLDFMTVGGFALYGSQDDDNGNEGLFNDYDYLPLYAWGDYVGALEGVTLFGLKASMPVNDQLKINGVIGYGFSNSDDNTKEYDGFEIDLGASYKITDALTYSVETAYVSWDADTQTGTMVDEDVLFMAHKLTLSF